MPEMISENFHVQPEKKKTKRNIYKSRGGGPPGLFYIPVPTFRGKFANGRPIRATDPRRGCGSPQERAGPLETQPEK